jgi:hypothetical protein
MIIACLGVFAAVVVADYFVQRKAAKDALATMATTKSLPTATQIPSVMPTATPSTAHDGLDDIVKAATSPEPDDFDQYVASPTPTPTPAPVQSPKLAPSLPSPESNSIENQQRDRTVFPSPSPATKPRVEHNIVSGDDILQVSTYGKTQDFRRYRFRLDGIARLRGSFSANGGGVTVRIISGGSTYYSSGSEISADEIDVALYPGTYELEVSLSTRGVVSFHVQLTAVYNPE